jgi:hypothetical protein
MQSSREKNKCADLAFVEGQRDSSTLIVTLICYLLVLVPSRTTNVSTDDAGVFFLSALSQPCQCHWKK